MPNPVHVLLTPSIDPKRILHSVKTFSAREANKLLDRAACRSGNVNTYDHCVRDSKEFDGIRFYIENNPVVAGLASAAQKYPWSSAAEASILAGFSNRTKL